MPALPCETRAYTCTLTQLVPGAMIRGVDSPAASAETRIEHLSVPGAESGVGQSSQPRLGFSRDPSVGSLCCGISCGHTARFGDDRSSRASSCGILVPLLSNIFLQSCPIGSWQTKQTPESVIMPSATTIPAPRSRFGPDDDTLGVGVGFAVGAGIVSNGLGPSAGMATGTSWNGADDISRGAPTDVRQGRSISNIRGLCTASGAQTFETVCIH